MKRLTPPRDPIPDIRLATTVYCRSLMRRPWGFRVAAGRQASFHLVVRGDCWLTVDGIQGARHLRSGDLVVLPYGHAHRLTDPDGAPAPALDHVLASHPMIDRCLEYGGAGPVTELLCGGFVPEHDLPSTLDPILVVNGRSGRPDDGIDEVVAIIRTELSSDAPGSAASVDRLSEVLLARVLRREIEAGRVRSTGADPQIDAAIRAIEANGTRTITEMARDVALSRSAFAARFKEATGVSPARFQRSVRISKAATLLRSTNGTLLQIARETGYGSEAALSRAFKRHFGVPPSDFRRTARPG